MPREPWRHGPDRLAEIAWAAGLFEGEGTIAPKRGKGNAHRYQAAIIMTDEDVVRRFGRTVEIGKVYGPYQPKNPKFRPIWRWTTTKHDEITELFRLIGDHLGERRRRTFEEALADVAAHPAVTLFHKLSATSHQQIRDRYARGDVTQSALAREFGVTQSMVSIITRPCRQLASEGVT